MNFSNISQYVEKEFPEIYRENGDMLVSFVKAYYEYLENDRESFINRQGQFEDVIDIDKTLDEFVEFFKETYLQDFPYITTTDKRFLVKHITDYYKSKGTKEGAKLLIKMIFGEETEVHFPSVDVIKPSASEWYEPVYIEVSNSSRLKEYNEQYITGTVSGARAFVSGLVRKRINGKLINILYLTDVQGDFNTGEIILLPDGKNKNAARIVGSLTSIEVTGGGFENEVGDIVNVEVEGAFSAKARVTETKNATQTVEFDIEDGGYGYTNDDSTNALISDSVLGVDNTDFHYPNYTRVSQNMERLYLTGNTFFENVTPGVEVFGYDSANNEIASGIVYRNNADEDNIFVQCSKAETFSNIHEITTDTELKANIGDTVLIGHDATLTLSDITGTLSVGDEIYQTKTVNGVSLTTVYGEISNVSGGVITLINVFGKFALGNIQTDSASATLTGITGNVSRQSVIQDMSGTGITLRGDTFSVGEKIRAEYAFRGNEVTVDTATYAGVETVMVGSDEATLTGVDEEYNEGIVIGQRESSIGISGNQFPFYSLLDSMYLETDRDIPMAKRVVKNVYTGSGANFEIGSLANTEIVSVYTDRLDDVNVMGIPFMNIGLDGSGSGVGEVTAVSVNDGGSGYANTTMALTGGGYAGGEPLSPASVDIVTDGSGVITTVTVTDPGQGYFEAPQIDLGSGSGADVSFQMEYGYGFPKDKEIADDGVMGDAFATEIKTIGSIKSLRRVNPGANYNIDQFALVENQYVSSMEVNEFVILCDNMEGRYSIGERVMQNNVVVGTVKETGDNYVTVYPVSFQSNIDHTLKLVGESTDTQADITGVIKPDNKDYMGDDGNISMSVVSATGVIKNVEVIDSGFGYVDNQSVDIINPKNGFGAKGISRLGKQGRGEGYWRTRTSHLNSEKKIQDSNYYQSFSYDIQTGIPIEYYRDVFKRILHVSGTKMFGSLVKTSSGDINVSSDGGDIEIITFENLFSNDITTIDTDKTTMDQLTLKQVTFDDGNKTMDSEEEVFNIKSNNKYV